MSEVTLNVNCCAEATGATLSGFAKAAASDPRRSGDYILDQLAKTSENRVEETGHELRLSCI